MLPSACEVDIAGVVGMYTLQLASGTPSALVDWNSNYGGDPEKCVFFHCGNWARDFLLDIRIATAPILGTTLGEENAFGALEGRTLAGPVTFGRVSMDDLSGTITAYVGEGEFTSNPLETFGTRAVVKVRGLSALMHVICQNGFEHHAAMTRGHAAAAVAEALSRHGAVGDICFRYYDAEGAPIKSQLMQRVIGIEPALLHKIPHVVGVAGGRRKVRAILAALRGRWINVLITDHRTASSLLDGKG